MLPSISAEGRKDQKTDSRGTTQLAASHAYKKSKVIQNEIYENLQGELLLAFVLSVLLRTYVTNINFMKRIKIMELLSTTDRVFRVGNISNFALP